jgi:hypothetical protein
MVYSQAWTTEWAGKDYENGLLSLTDLRKTPPPTANQPPKAAGKNTWRI